MTTRSLAPVPAAANTPTSAEALRGAVPTLVVHRSHSHFRDIPALVTRAQREARNEAAIAVATRMTRQSPAGTRTFLDNNKHAALRIADPEVHIAPGPNQARHARPAKDAAQHYSWARQVPATAEPAWVQEVLQSQVDAGANVLLSASGWVDTAGTRELDSTMAFVAESRNQLAADDPMFVNLTLHHTWLDTPQFRRHLLAEMVENPEKLWWIRIMWPRLSPNHFTQLRAQKVLDGYRELARTAKAEGKVVFLPNSGLTGWFATALGASGFSTGMSGAERTYEDKPPQGGGGGYEEKQRHFDANALHTLLRTDHVDFARVSGHQRCGCNYCRSFPRGWVKKDEQLHYLLNVARLTRDLGRVPSSRLSNARALVDAAATMVSNLPANRALVEESAPRHLAMWQALLR